MPVRPLRHADGSLLQFAPASALLARPTPPLLISGRTRQAFDLMGMVMGPDHPLYKTALCDKWHNTTPGCCRYGDRCVFVHDVSEQREIPDSPAYRANDHRAMSRARNLKRATTHRATSTYIGDFSTARRNIIMAASAAGPVDRGNAWDRVPAQTRARVDLGS